MYRLATKDQILGGYPAPHLPYMSELTPFREIWCYPELPERAATSGHFVQSFFRPNGPQWGQLNRMGDQRPCLAASIGMETMEVNPIRLSTPVIPLVMDPLR